MNVVGPLQEALEAMFALINEMEIAIKINTSIIFGNTERLVGEAQPLNRGAVSRLKEKERKRKSGQPGKEILHQHERVLRALPFVVGCVKRLFLVYFELAAF